MKFEDGYVASVPKRNQSRLNRRGKHLSSLGLALVLLISSQAAAETLDSAALEKLALQGTWASEIERVAIGAGIKIKRFVCA